MKWRGFARLIPLLSAFHLTGCTDAIPPPPARKIPKPSPSLGVVLNEIHYHPASTQGSSEFVEFHNAGTTAVDLSGWSLSRGIRFEFPQGSSLNPGGFAVICANRKAFRQVFGDAVPLAGEYGGRLDNAGDLIRLQDADSKTVTDLWYLDGPPWPEKADGRGMSLSRIEAERDTDDPSNWKAAKPTPGAPNQVSDPRPKLSLYRARHDPEAPRPGDPVKISVSVREPGAPVKVQLHYEVHGREIRRREQSLAMERNPKSGADAGGDPIYSTALPPQRANTLVRYWISASGSGFNLRTPPREAPTSNLAFYVQEPVQTKLPLYSILMEPRDLQALQRNFRSNQLYPAAFIANGEVYDRVLVRHRGDWARTWPKKAWKIVFRKDRPFGKKQRLNLNSAWRDPAFIREPLAYEIYQMAGSLSLRSKMVRLHLNGEFWGLAVEVEQPKSQYLARVGLRGAVLYKGTSRGNGADEKDYPTREQYARYYTLESGRDSNFQDLWEFCRDASQAGDLVSFFESRIDLPRYINYLCAGALTQNWDAFTKNHFIAFDVENSGKWTWIPWDLDRTLGDHWRWSFDSTDLPVLQGIQHYPGPTGWNRIQDLFLREPALRDRFFNRLQELLQDTFTEERLLERIDALEETIKGEADADRRKWGIGLGRGSPSLRAGVEQLKNYIVQRRKFLLEQLPGNEPEVPKNLKPFAGVQVDGDPVILETNPFTHKNPRIRHRMSHLQVREESGSYLTPVLDQIHETSLERFSLPRGVVLPGKTYFWHVAYIASNGKSSQFSQETSFRTGEFPMKVVHFDLSSQFNRDVVANPGDNSQEPLDDSSGMLIVDGYDGFQTDNPLANGLPQDRRAGIHRLGDYDGPNALQLSWRDRTPIRISVPPGQYSFIRFLVTGKGDSQMPITFEYSDGSRERATIPCDDWYEDNPPGGPPGSLQPGVLPVLNEMDRIRSDGYKDRNEPALFEVSLPVNSGKVLAAVILNSERAVFKMGSRGRFNLFAVTGIQMGIR